MYKKSIHKYANNKFMVLGVTMFEIILSLTIISIITASLGSFAYKYYQKMQTTKYLESTNAYAMAFLRYIQDNQDTFTQNISVVKASDILLKHYLPAGIGVYNKYNHTPCVLIRKNNNNNQLEAFMYYLTDQNNQNAISNTIHYNILAQGNIEAGIYNASKKITNGVNNAWNLDSASIWSPENNATNFASCDQANFANNSIIINLKLLSKNLDPEINSNNQNLDLKNIGDSCSKDDIGTLAENANKNMNDVFSETFAPILICRITTANYKSCKNFESCYAPLSKLSFVRDLSKLNLSTYTCNEPGFPYTDNSFNSGRVAFSDKIYVNSSSIYGYQTVKSITRYPIRYGNCTFEVPSFNQ